MRISAGDRTVCLAIEQPGTGEDELGQPVEGWVDLDPVREIWAKLVAKRGIESEQSDQRVASAMYYAEVDYLDARGVTTKMRARLDVPDPVDSYPARYFDIIAIMPDEVSRETTLFHLREVIDTQGY